MVSSLWTSGGEGLKCLSNSQAASTGPPPRRSHYRFLVAVLVVTDFGWGGRPPYGLTVPCHSQAVLREHRESQNQTCIVEWLICWQILWQPHSRVCTNYSTVFYNIFWPIHTQNKNFRKFLSERRVMKRWAYHMAGLLHSESLPMGRK